MATVWCAGHTTRSMPGQRAFPPRCEWARGALVWCTERPWRTQTVLSRDSSRWANHNALFEKLKLRLRKSERKCRLSVLTWSGGHLAVGLTCYWCITYCVCYCRTACWTGSSWRRASTQRWTNFQSESSPFPPVGVLVHAGFFQTLSSTFNMSLKQ